MPYRMITRIGNLCGRLAGAAVEHADRIVSSLTQRWAARLEVGEELTVAKLLAFVAEDLRQIHAQIVDTEGQLRSEIREDKQSRDLRDRALSALRELLFDVKKVCDAHYGPGSVETLFEEDSEEVPEEPSEVLRLATRVRHNMTNPEFPLPPLKRGIAPDFAALAGRFDEPLAQLEASRAQLEQDQHGSSAKIADKEQELVEMQGLAGRAGRVLESLTAYAGHEGVARRIRLSRHRARAGIEDPEDDPEIEAAEPPPEGDGAAENEETGA